MRTFEGARSTSVPVAPPDASSSPPADGMFVPACPPQARRRPHVPAPAHTPSTGRNRALVVRAVARAWPALRRALGTSAMVAGSTGVQLFATDRAREEHAGEGAVPVVTGADLMGALLEVDVPNDVILGLFAAAAPRRFVTSTRRPE